jgi:UDP-N-acetylmuramoyl-tripeptide--D-alanyl-D-alanine ligase
VLAHDIDLVFCSGPLMRALWEALPPERRGGYAETAAGLESDVLGAVHAGDAVMVKGSLGSKMGPIVAALARKYSSRSPIAAAQG